MSREHFKNRFIDPVIYVICASALLIFMSKTSLAVDDKNYSGKHVLSFNSDWEIYRMDVNGQFFDCAAVTQKDDVSGVAGLAVARLGFMAVDIPKSLFDHPPLPIAGIITIGTTNYADGRVRDHGKDVEFYLRPIEVDMALKSDLVLITIGSSQARLNLQPFDKLISNLENCKDTYVQFQ